MKKPFKITYSRKYKTYTVWKTTRNDMYPIVIGAKSISDAWARASLNPLWGKAFK